jgi:hypothetical protein
MTRPSLSLRLLDAVPLTSGEVFHARVSIDADDTILAAAQLELFLSPALFREVSIRDLAFTAPNATGLAIRVGEDGRARVAGARANGSTGVTDVCEVTARLVAPAGTRAMFTASCLSAVSTDGRALPLRFASLDVNVASATLGIVTTTLEVGRVGVPLHQRLIFAGGVPPHRWRLVGGTLADGVVLDPTGLLHGTPSLARTWTFTVAVEDSSVPVPAHQERTFTHVIGPAPLAIVTTSLPPIANGTTFSTQLESRGGVAPIHWDVGRLPPGLSLVQDVISGTPLLDDPDQSSILLQVSATDTSEPPEAVTTELVLPIVALLPSTRVAAGGATAVAVGRDVVVVTYDVTLQVTASAPRTAEFESAVQRLRDAILDEIVYMLVDDVEDPLADLVIPDPDDITGSWQSSGDSEHARRQAKMAALNDALSKLDKERLGVGTEVEVALDGDAFITLHGPVQLPPSSSRFLWPPDNSKLGREVRTAYELVAPLVRSWIGAQLSASPPGPPMPERKKQETPDREVASGKEMARATPLSGSRAGVGVVRGFWMAAAVGLAATSAVWGVAGALAGALIIGGIHVAGVIYFKNGVQSALSDLAAARSDWEMVGNFDPIPFPVWATAELHCTPGAHRLKVSWSATEWPVVIPEEDRDVLFGKPAIRVSFKPRNPEDWPRLRETTVVDLGARPFSGESEGPINLSSSDIDIAVATANGGVRVIPGRGDGTFASPRSVSVTGGGRTARIRIAKLDPIGRSSIISSNGDALRVWLNDGVFGLVEHVVAVSSTNETLGAFDAGDIDGDGWSELLVSDGSMLRQVDRLAGLVHRSGNAEHSVDIGISSRVGNDDITSILLSTDLAVPSGSTETRPGFAHMLALGRFAGEGVVWRNGNNGRFGDRLMLPGLDAVSPTLQPVDAVIGAFFGSATTLVVALRQAREIRMWRPQPDGLQAIYTVPLGFRPLELAAAPSGVRGLLVASFGRGQVYLLVPGGRTRMRVLRVLDGAGQARIASGEGISAILSDGVLAIYR